MYRDAAYNRATALHIYQTVTKSGYINLDGVFYDAACTPKRFGLKNGKVTP